MTIRTRLTAWYASIMFVSLPVLVITLGLFFVVLTAAMLHITSALATRLQIPFHVDGVDPAFEGALLVRVASTVVGWILVPRERDDD